MSYQEFAINKVLAEVLAEVVRAATLHPPHHSLPETLGVLMLEIGEATAAIHARDVCHAETELLQCAAVCVRGVMASRARRAAETPLNRHAEGEAS